MPVYQGIHGNTIAPACTILLTFCLFFLKTRKIPCSEEQGNDLESLDFPVSAHPSASTVLGYARRLHAIAVACRTFVRPSGISAWRTAAHDERLWGRTLSKMQSVCMRRNIHTKRERRRRLGRRCGDVRLWYDEHLMRSDGIVGWGRYYSCICEGNSL